MNASARSLRQSYGSTVSRFGQAAPYRRSRIRRRSADPAKRLLAFMLIFGALSAGFWAEPYLSDKFARMEARLPYAAVLRQWVDGRRVDESPVVLRPTRGSLVSARAMPSCGDGYRINCVVDGDTIWVNGEKIRLETIDAPEVHGRCAYETRLAAQATDRLRTLVSGHEMTIARSGRDIYGRTLARVSTDQGEVGGILAGEGLARRWTGHRKPWC